LADEPSFRKDCRGSREFQIGSPPKMTTDEEDAMIPTENKSISLTKIEWE
jgi:hypothetical protein